jgi:hypothetical protein
LCPLPGGDATGRVWGEAAAGSDAPRAPGLQVTDMDTVEISLPLADLYQGLAFPA